MRKKVFLTAALVLLAVLTLRSCFDEPSIKFGIESGNVGTRPFTVEFKGVGEGLKSIQVSYVGKENTILLETKQYPEGVEQDTVSISLNPFSGIEDGPAQIRATAEAYGGAKIGEPGVSKTIDIVADLSPPKITVISGTENITRSGSGVIVYKVSSDAVESGVKIGDKLFKGYKAAPNAGIVDEEVRIAFFSYPYDMEEGETVLVTATDTIGNKRNLPVSYKLKKKSFSKFDIEVTEKFVKMKMLPLVSSSEKMSLKEVFLLVNKKIRAVNNRKIEEVLSRTGDKIMWEGVFIRPVGKLQSDFEERKYFFNGELIDKQKHLGYDIASQRKNPVRASNSGVVVFSDDLGIYGNTLIIDHGMGVATLYAHLSGMTVQRGDTVAKGDTIGGTGETGLAFGDHLHFGIYIGATPVVPVEWWDSFWVETRITDKIEAARGR